MYTKPVFFTTNYQPDQLYISGEYPVECSYDTKLGNYIKDNESIDNESIIWYTIGMPKLNKLNEINHNKPSISQNNETFTLSTSQKQI